MLLRLLQCVPQARDGGEQSLHARGYHYFLLGLDSAEFILGCLEVGQGVHQRISTSTSSTGISDALLGVEFRSIRLRVLVAGVHNSFENPLYGPQLAAQLLLCPKTFAMPP